jgi:hypothetical protein
MTTLHATLHTQEGFVLVAVDKDHATSDWESWIVHECDGMGPDGDVPSDGIRWGDVMWQGKCRWCGTPFPDEIYGLWKLHNFERLQQWSGCP